MKNILVITLSLHLVIAPVAVHAQTDDAYLTERASRSGTGSRGGYDFYVKQVLMLGSGIVGANLINGRPEHWFTLSPWIFAGGAITLLISEINGASKKNRSHERKMRDLKIEEGKIDPDRNRDGKITAEEVASASAQLPMIEQALVEENENLEFIQDRKRWNNIVKVVYMGAVAMALVESIMLPMQAPPAGIDVFGYEAGGFSVNGSTVGDAAVMGIGLAYGLAPHMVSGSMVGNVGMGAGAALLGVSKTAFIKTLSQFNQTVSNQINSVINTPYGRLAVFGVFMGLAEVVSRGLTERERIARDNIRKLTAVRDQIKGMSHGVAVPESPLPVLAGGPGVGDPVINPGAGAGPTKPTTVAEVEPIKLPVNCLGTSGGGFSVSTSNCSSPFQMNYNVPDIKIPVIQQTAANTMAMVNAMAKGDTATAELNGNTIVANAAALTKVTEQLKKDLNKNLKAQGKPEIDFDGETNKLMASIGGEAQKLASANGLTGAHSPVIADSSRDSSSPADSSQAGDHNVNTNNSIQLPAAPVMELGKMGGEDSSTDMTDKSLAASSAPSFSDFQLQNEDILRTSDVSIFKQVSMRYMLSLPRILERKRNIGAQENEPQ